MDGDFDAVINALGTKPGATPNGFPRVSAQQQINRDSDSVKILQDELANETNPDNRLAIQNQISRTQRASAAGNPFGTTLSAPGGPSVASAGPTQSQAPDDDFTAVVKALGGANSSLPATAQPSAASSQPNLPQSGGSVPTIEVHGQSGPVIYRPAGESQPEQGPPTSIENVPTGSAAVLGGAKGVFDTLVGGPAQLIAHGVSSAARGLGAAPDSVLGSLDTSVDDATKNREAMFNDITQGHETAANVGQVLGGAGAALMLPVGKVAEGAGLVSRLIAAGKTGAAVGATQPVLDTDNYWGHKAAETILGGASGAMAQPVAELGTKAVGTIASKVINAGKNVVAKLTGSALPDIAANASPELQAAVKSAQASGQKIDPVALGRQVEADSLPVKMSLTPGQASQDPIAISTEQNLRSKNPAMVQRFNDQNTQLVQNLNAIRDEAAPTAVAPDHITAGQTVIDSLAAKNKSLSDATSTAYKKLQDANGGDFPLDGMTFAAKANEALGQNFKGAFLPREVQGILQKLSSGEQPMTFENFENLRTILGEEARNAKSGNVAGAVNTVRSALESMPMTAETEEIKPLADAARATAKAHFDQLDSTPSLKAVDAGKATPDDFIQKHVISAKRGDLINTVKAIGDDAPALETLKAGVVNYLKKSAGIIDDQGNFSQAGYNKAFAALKPKLDVLFDADEAKQLQTLGNVARYTQAQPRGSFVNNSNTDVSNLARGGGAMLAHGVNAVTGTPVGSLAQGLISKSLAEKASASQLRDLLGPGAGIAKPGKASVFLKDILPPYAGRVAGLPLAKLASDQVK